MTLTKATAMQHCCCTGRYYLLSMMPEGQRRINSSQYIQFRKRNVRKRISQNLSIRYRLWSANIATTDLGTNYLIPDQHSPSCQVWNMYMHSLIALLSSQPNTKRKKNEVPLLISLSFLCYIKKWVHVCLPVTTLVIKWHMKIICNASHWIGDLSKCTEVK